MNQIELKTYFETHTGLGVLSTADSNGIVNSAIYSRPHVMPDGTFAFIMANRRSHSNITANPNATFLFKEDGSGYKGIRLYLKKINEEKNSPLINELRRGSHGNESSDMGDRFLVFFAITDNRTLTGDGKLF